MQTMHSTTKTHEHGKGWEPPADEHSSPATLQLLPKQTSQLARNIAEAIASSYIAFQRNGAMLPDWSELVQRELDKERATVTQHTGAATAITILQGLLDDTLEYCDCDPFINPDCTCDIEDQPITRKMIKARVRQLEAQLNEVQS